MVGVMTSRHIDVRYMSYLQPQSQIVQSMRRGARSEKNIMHFKSVPSFYSSSL